MESVEILNEQEVKRLVPLITFLIVIIVVGIPGNLSVCSMYRIMYRNSSSRFFILALAAVDCFGCLVVSLEVVNVVQQYTFTNDNLCKATIFLEFWPILTSGSLLLIISIDRYRKVCHPFKWQLTFKTGRILFAISVVLSLVCSVPALVLYGITEVRFPGQNVTGTECSILEEYKESSFSKIYNGMFLVQFVFALTLLTAMYSMVCIQVLKHEKGARHRSNGVKNSSTEGDPGGNKDTQTQNKQSKPEANIGNGKSPTILKLNNQLRRHGSAQRTSKRLTYIMCIISIVFVISFLPYAILRLLQAFKDGFIESMSDTDRALYKTFLRTYFLNCAINPLIYCACSAKFRREFVRFFKNIFYRY